MSSAEEDVLVERWLDLISSIVNYDVNAFGDGVCAAAFVPNSRFRDTLSKIGVSDYSKASEIMSAVKTNITLQATPERITRKFSDFVMLLHSMKLHHLAQRLEDGLSKCT